MDNSQELRNELITTANSLDEKSQVQGAISVDGKMQLVGLNTTLPSMIGTLMLAVFELLGNVKTETTRSKIIKDKD